jgi:hypothetical protein
MHLWFPPDRGGTSRATSLRVTGWTSRTSGRYAVGLRPILYPHPQRSAARNPPNNPKQRKPGG